ncbi:hypothetical protein MZD04_gp057 [Pseudomonas phage Psa21]|uniref:Uncharacterized protein n=1 Tax=Pseudomonas phage Psa21 TaxID=2530023 RepID=A0A481W6U8_9CAUD|nr:hypothetical protein MZD04_gp057 [Pseudomonas phage Psa21]QBJ02947.1 hypothetical protein PSA21_57 [Pseudomonas phage Psa21]
MRHGGLASPRNTVYLLLGGMLISTSRLHHRKFLITSRLWQVINTHKRQTFRVHALAIELVCCSKLVGAGITFKLSVLPRA